MSRNVFAVVNGAPARLTPISGVQRLQLIALAERLYIKFDHGGPTPALRSLLSERGILFVLVKKDVLLPYKGDREPWSDRTTITEATTP